MSRNSVKISHIETQCLNFGLDALSKSHDLDDAVEVKNGLPVASTGNVAIASGGTIHLSDNNLHVGTTTTQMVVAPTQILARSISGNIPFVPTTAAISRVGNLWSVINNSTFQTSWPHTDPTLVTDGVTLTPNYIHILCVMKRFSKQSQFSLLISSSSFTGMKILLVNRDFSIDHTIEFVLPSGSSPTIEVKLDTTRLFFIDNPFILSTLTTCNVIISRIDGPSESYIRISCKRMNESKNNTFISEMGECVVASLGDSPVYLALILPDTATFREGYINTTEPGASFNIRSNALAQLYPGSATIPNRLLDYYVVGSPVTNGSNTVVTNVDTVTYGQLLDLQTNPRQTIKFAPEILIYILVSGTTPAIIEFMNARDGMQTKKVQFKMFSPNASSCQLVIDDGSVGDPRTTSISTGTAQQSLCVYFTPTHVVVHRLGNVIYAATNVVSNLYSPLDDLYIRISSASSSPVTFTTLTVYA